MDRDTTPKFDLPTLRDLRQTVYALSQSTSEADWHELSPLWAWAGADSFALLGEGPFRAPIKHPNGRNLPPDWEIRSEFERIAIEISRITTPQTERAARVGKSAFDMPGLLTNKHPGPDFDKTLQQQQSDDFWDDALEAERTFDEQIIRVLDAKTADLARYTDDFDRAVLLLHDRLWSGAQLSERLARIAGLRKTVGVRQFAAVFVTDGTWGQVASLPT